MEQLTKKKLINFLNRKMKDNKIRDKVPALHDYMFGYRTALLDVEAFIRDMYD